MRMMAPSSSASRRKLLTDSTSCASPKPESHSSSPSRHALSIESAQLSESVRMTMHMPLPASLHISRKSRTSYSTAAISACAIVAFFGRLPPRYLGRAATPGGNAPRTRPHATRLFLPGIVSGTSEPSVAMT